MSNFFRSAAMAVALPALLCQYAKAQTRYHYSLTITDPAYVPSLIPATGGMLTLNFHNLALNSAAQGAHVYLFRKAYAGFSSPLLNNLYFLTTDDPNYIYRLQNTNARVFNYIAPSADTRSLGGNPPNDYIDHYYGYNSFGWTDTMQELKWINAPQAWAVTQGDTGTRIGVIDSWFQLNHGELNGKFAKVRDSVSHAPMPGPTSVPTFTDTINYVHGTRVAGLLAGKTDNSSYGLASIGYNCRLVAATLPPSAPMAIDVMTQMSRYDNVQIFNNSWENGDNSYLYCAPSLADEIALNKIYENGGSIVFSAGNSVNGCISAGAQDYHYPASYNNVISVTSVGHLTNSGAAFHQPGHKHDGQQWSIKDLHEANQGDTLSAVTHNDRVDICAPGYGINVIEPYSLYAQPNMRHNWGEGTSYSAPLVAGTMALMRTINPNLSPYQREWILKNSAQPIYNVGNNNLYAGKLGAGRLDAGAALNMADHKYADQNITNNPDLQTMWIEGIDINSLCGASMLNDPNAPQIKAIVRNGTPPLRYEWVAFPAPDNDVMLTDPASATPSLQPNPNFHYLLRVYDNSFVQKVALKEFKFTLANPSGPGGYDLAMKDSWMDMLNEPGNMETMDFNDWNIWHSPDIWNRRQPDGITDHEDPEYFSNGAPNFAYVRVRNTGCSLRLRAPSCMCTGQ